MIDIDYLLVYLLCSDRKCNEFSGCTIFYSILCMKRIGVGGGGESRL